MAHTIERNTDEIDEIERHKYFLSEKAGYDVGWDYAEQDWRANYSDEFRRRFVPKPKLGNTNSISMLFKRLFSQ